MAAFDRLPKSLRAALRDADHDFSAVQMRQELHSKKAVP